jgi:glucokinase
MIDPDAVIVTGGLARAGRLWWDALTGGVRQEAVSQVRGCPIVPAQTGPNAAILGAAAYAELSIERSDTTEGFRP